MEYEDVIRALGDARSYPEYEGRPGSPRDWPLTHIQTAISHVFLTERFAYKLKKPLALGFLDYSTLEKRLRFCRLELELNRRLAPSMYLAVVGMGLEGGRLRLERGEPVEYAVKMRRLPAERMMDVMLDRGEVTRAMVEAVAERVADFHASARTGGEVDEGGLFATIRGNWDENFQQTRPFVDEIISRDRFASVRGYVDDFLGSHGALLEERVRAGCIRDCHGDLHSRNICIADNDIYIYDCIEFNHRFRYGDVASEVAFLAMDLDYHDGPELGSHFAHHYAERAGDAELPDLLDFYRCYRAFVRGKVLCLELAEREIDSEQRRSDMEAARRYFALAYLYALGPHRPLLLVICGMTASGKSTLAGSFRGRAAIISSDLVRKELAGITPTERRREDFESGIYSPEFTRRTYGEMMREAERILEGGDSVVLDATFARHEQRRAAWELARMTGAHFFLVECRAPDEVLLKRLEQKTHDPWEISDARPDLFGRLLESWEPPDEIPFDMRVRLDTSQPLADTLASLRRAVPGLGNRSERGD